MILYYETKCPVCTGTGSVANGWDGCFHCLGQKTVFAPVTVPDMLRSALKKLIKKPISKLGKAV